MSTKNEVHQVDMQQHVLHLYVVIDAICKYATGKDLSNMAKVCKSWRSAVLREKVKRNYIQQLRLLHKTRHVMNSLDNIPFVSLMIYETALEKSLSLPLFEDKMSWICTNGFEEQLLKDFKEQLPNTTVVLKVDKYLTMKEVECLDSKEQCDLKLTDHFDVLGFFLPNVDGRLRIHVAFGRDPKRQMPRSRNEVMRKTFSNSLAEELGLYNCEFRKITIILLSHSSLLVAYIMKDLEIRAKENDKEITWASLFGSKLVVSRENSELTINQPCVLLSISGPTVESYSTFIHFLAPRDEIESKLQKLKEQVKRKRHNTGLLYALTCEQPGCSHAEHPSGNSHEMMNSLRLIFPHIQFTGFFRNYQLRFQFPDRSIEDDAFNNQEFFDKLTLYTSIIIISY